MTKHKLLLLTLSLMCLPLHTLAKAPTTKPARSFLLDVTAKKTKKLIQTTRGLIILDVRTSWEFRKGYIPGARNVNIYSRSFVPLLKTYPRNATYLIYCHSGGRSQAVFQLMKRLAFTRVYHFTGGFSTWKRKGYPVKLPSKAK
jgi:rhodanese-related sulfurtransferase